MLRSEPKPVAAVDLDFRNLCLIRSFNMHNYNIKMTFIANEFIADIRDDMGLISHHQPSSASPTTHIGYTKIFINSEFAYTIW